MSRKVPFREALEIELVGEVLGCMVFVSAEPGRIDRLSGDRFRSDDLDIAYAYLVTFVTGGLQAVLVPRRETRSVQTKSPGRKAAARSMAAKA